MRDKFVKKPAYGGDDGDGKHEGVWKRPLVCPIVVLSLHLVTMSVKTKTSVTSYIMQDMCLKVRQDFQSFDSPVFLPDSLFCKYVQYVNGFISYLLPTR